MAEIIGGKVTNLTAPESIDCVKVLVTELQESAGKEPYTYPQLMSFAQHVISVIRETR